MSKSKCYFESDCKKAIKSKDCCMTCTAYYSICGLDTFAKDAEELAETENNVIYLEDYRHNRK